MKITAVVSGLLSVILLVAGGCKTTEEEEKGTKVLMIGNSFSISLLQHLPEVAADRGVDLDLASLYIGGCSLRQHCENMGKDGDETFKPYLFGRNRFGEYSQSKINVCDALRLAKWDVVTVQQASHESWRPESYTTYGDKLIAKIRELAPQAKIYVQETWSYTPWDKRLAKWGITPDEMYDRLHAAYAAFAKAHGLTVIPFGSAVQSWRRRLPVAYAENSFGRDVVGGRACAKEDCFRRNAAYEWVPNCDVFHLNERGEYFQALVWLSAVLGGDPLAVKYCPPFVPKDEELLMKTIAAGLK